MNNVRGHFCIVVGLSQRKGQAWPYWLNCTWIQRQHEIFSSLTQINNFFCRQPLWSHQSWSWRKAWPAERKGGTWCFVVSGRGGEAERWAPVLPRIPVSLHWCGLAFVSSQPGLGVLDQRWVWDLQSGVQQVHFTVMTASLILLWVFLHLMLLVDRGMWLRYNLCFRWMKTYQEPLSSLCNYRKKHEKVI